MASEELQEEMEFDDPRDRSTPERAGDHQTL